MEKKIILKPCDKNYFRKEMIFYKSKLLEEEVVWYNLIFKNYLLNAASNNNLEYPLSGFLKIFEVKPFSTTVP